MSSSRNPRGGLNSRGGGSFPRGADASGSVVLQMEADGDVDEEVQRLRDQVSMLKRITFDVDRETQVQKSILDDLEASMAKAQAMLKRTMKKLDVAFANAGSNHLMYLALFAFACFFAAYLYIRARRYLPTLSLPISKSLSTASAAWLGV
eukprot:jgi/Mesvir1/166/Mv13525-RA.1